MSNMSRHAFLSRVYGEGRSDVLGERWFTTIYAVPTKATVEARFFEHGQWWRLVRVKTVSQMEVVRESRRTGSERRAGLGEHG